MMKQPEPGGEQKRDPAFEEVVDIPGLPRVLLIGDSISIGYTLPVRQMLFGLVNLHRVKDNCGPTSTGVANIDQWVGKGHWDAIHFNFGLHDIKLMPELNGAHQVELPQYLENLKQIIKRLQATGARLIWASTTPVPEGKLSPARNPADVPLYNAAARQLMLENKISIADLFTVFFTRMKDIQIPANVHFTPAGSKSLGEQVAASILYALREAER